MDDPNNEINNLNQNTLQGIDLNRFLIKQNMDVIGGSMSPFQGIMPYQNNNSSMVYNNPMNSYNQSSTRIEPGTLITDCLVRTSPGGQLLPGAPLLNGRVEMNRGFVDEKPEQFPYDSLTAFHPNGIASVVLYYAGILLNADTASVSGVIPSITYIIGAKQYLQPISFGTGTVRADGTHTTNFPSGWTSVQTSTGSYTITPDTPFAFSKYSVLLTTVDTTSNTAMAMSANKTAAGFDVFTFDPTTGVNVDCEFDFVVFTTL